MKNLHDALVNNNFTNDIKISSPIPFTSLQNSYPSSAGSFRPDLVESVFKPLLDFLRQTGSYLMVNAYPFFAYASNSHDIPLDYALFRENPGVVDAGNGLRYFSLFDAQIDAVFAAMSALKYDDIKVVVTETGWPSKGDENEVGASYRFTLRIVGQGTRGFMKTYHHVPQNSDNIVVFPSRAVAIENALRLFSPRLAVVDEHLTRHLPRQWLTSLVIQNTGSDNPSQDILTVIEALRESDLMIEVIKKLKPQVVVTVIAHFEAITSSAFEHLLRTRLRTLTCSNYLWPSKKSGLFRSGSSFHHFRRRGHLQGIVQDCRTTRGDHCLSVLNNSLSINEAEYTALIHMDVDQSFLPIPSAVKAAIFESFARQNMADSEIDVTSSIKHFIKRNFGFPTDSSTEFVIADSSLALFNK
ncbi:hypothetical protein CMV_021603, partial [Castanea mollissima]